MVSKKVVGPGGHEPPGRLDACVTSFVGQLRSAAYSECTIRKRRAAVRAFVRWIEARRLPLTGLDGFQVDAFLARFKRQSKDRFARERAALRLFLRHLRAEGEIPDPTPRGESSPEDELGRRYVDYLRNDRGLAENSILVYSPYIRDFLGERARHGSVSPADIDAFSVQDFLLDRMRGRSSEWSRLLATALRSFLRFLYNSGETDRDLSRAVPTVRKWRQAEVPAFLSPEDVKRVLSRTDRPTPRGRRDHAILLLLARLGLRAGEVLKLELDDIRWRESEVVVRGKGGTVDRFPLPSDVGEAMALYLRKDRSVRTSRRVFVRMLAPHVGLAGPAAISGVVRAALARAGIRRSSRGAAHIFRHSLATRMIRQGATMAEISEVLRHRSQNTTAIYAKVSFEALRGVARPWPGRGGAR
jgi:integrase/recombinase XerD